MLLFSRYSNLNCAVKSEKRMLFVTFNFFNINDALIKIFENVLRTEEVIFQCFFFTLFLCI